MAYILNTKGEKIEMNPDNGTDFQLEELQTIVGGHIEIIPCNEEGKICVLNEEGKLLGLEYNYKATELVNKKIAIDDFIVGDVLICDSNMVK